VVFEGGDDAAEVKKVEPTKAWVFYATGAMLCFTINNSAMCEITEKAGGECL